MEVLRTTAFAKGGRSALARGCVTPRARALQVAISWLTHLNLKALQKKHEFCKKFCNFAFRGVMMPGLVFLTLLPEAR